MEHKSVLNQSFPSTCMTAAFASAGAAGVAVIVGAILISFNRAKIRRIFAAVGVADHLAEKKILLFERYYAEIYPYFTKDELEKTPTVEKWDFFATQDPDAAAGFYNELLNIKTMDDIQKPGLLESLVSKYRPQYLRSIEQLAGLQSGGAKEYICQGMELFNEMSDLEGYKLFITYFSLAFGETDQQLRPVCNDISAIFYRKQFGTLARRYPMIFENIVKAARNFRSLDPKVVTKFKYAMTQMKSIISHDTDLTIRVYQAADSYKGYVKVAAASVQTSEATVTSAEHLINSTQIPTAQDTTRTASSFDKAFLDAGASILEVNPNTEKVQLAKNNALFTDGAREFSAVKRIKLFNMRVMIIVAICVVIFIILTLVLCLIATATKN